MSTTPSTTQPKTGAGSRLNAKRRKLDEALRTALLLHTDSAERWDKLIAAGATDEEIWQALKREFGSGGGSQTEGGVQFAYAGGDSFSAPPKFWLDSGSHYTQQKPTLSGAALVRHVRELMGIPAGTPSSEAASGDGKRDFAEPTVTEVTEPTLKERTAATLDLKTKLKAEGWKFRDYADGRWAATHKARGLKTVKHDSMVEVIYEAARLAEEHTAEIENDGRPAEAGDEAHTLGSFNPDEERQSLLDATETEQRGRWAALTELHARPRQTKKSRAEITRLSEEYDATYSSIADAFSQDEALSMRERVETEFVPDDAASTTDTLGEVSSSRRAEMDAACGPDCGHTQKEHDVFDAGLAAGESGWPESSCLITDGSLREAWLMGHSEGAGNRSATLANEETRQQLIAERGGQVNESGVYVEGAEIVPVKVPRKLGGAVSLEVVQDRTDGKWRSGYHYHGGGRAPWFDNGCVVGQPFDTRDEALAAAAYEVAQSAPALDSYMEQFVKGLDIPTSELAASAVHVEDGDVVEPTPVVETAPAAPRTFTDVIEVKLNDHDIAEKARKASFLALQIEELEAEKKESDATYKKRIGGLEEERDKLMRQIRHGRDELELKVYEHRDYERHVVETMRADTHEVVASRAMKPTEYQQPLIAL
jgi:hypothetical protein